MSSRSPSKQRLEELIALARTYRGWSNRDLARALGRDVHHIIPDSGVPKLDIVVELAKALDWTVQDVVDDLYGNPPSADADAASAESWAELDKRWWRAFRDGELEEALSIALREESAASTGAERARSINRQFAAWEALGCYQRAAEAVQRAMRQTDIASGTVLSLRNNLAIALHYLGRHVEAEGVATATLDMIRSRVLVSDFLTASTGYAHFVRASSRIALALNKAEPVSHYVDGATADLESALSLYREASSTANVPAHAAVQHMCEGLSRLARVLAGVQAPGDAAAELVAELEAVTDPASLPRDSRLEAFGWWCVYGAQIASVPGWSDDDRCRLMGIFTNKANEIAARLNNWALRERVWALELARRTAFAGEGSDDWTVDREDVREISGAMARFPEFRPIGWKVLRSVRIRDLERESS